jgi:hypothetical protein
MLAGLALTASGFLNCKDFYIDEFLDLALVFALPVIPVFGHHRNTHPLAPLFLGIGFLHWG